MSKLFTCNKIINSIPPYSGTPVIIEYLTEKISTYRITGPNKTEFTMPSPFYQDSKFHLSVNLQTGLWRCFHTEETGNFISLVAKLENLSYKEAEKFLSKKYIKNINQIPLLLQNSKKEDKKIKFNEILLEKYFFSLIKKCKNSILVSKVITFLTKRGLEEWIDDFFICEQGAFFSRLIIPYYYDKKLLFFQGRTIFDLKRSDIPKYLSPPSEEINIGAGDILYPFDTSKDSLFICEGPLDAIILQKAGINATSLQGSFISDNQIKQIKKSKIKNLILAFDNDEAGKKATFKAKKHLLKKGYLKFKIALISDKSIKDWNDLWVKNKHLGLNIYKQKILSSIYNLDECTEFLIKTQQTETLQKQKSDQIE